jgi:diaminopimelate decarboxylase
MRENKFGVAHTEAERLYAKATAMPGVEVVGIGCHIGSQLAEPAPLLAAVERLVALADRVQRAGIALRHFDIGGGLGIRYKDEAQRPPGEFIAGVLRALGARRETLIVDPGRSIVGNAGVLLTRVEYVKPGAARNFVVVDAAMNDLIRPSLYGAWHDIRTVRESAGQTGVYDIVGPVCESADFLAKDRSLAAREGDLLAVMSAGAYGMVMSSNYNSRPRPAEVLVEGETAHLVRRRESVDDLFALERDPA